MRYQYVTSKIHHTFTAAMKCLSQNILKAFYRAGDNTTWPVDHEEFWEHEKYISIIIGFVIFIFLVTSNLVMIVGILKTNKRIAIPKKMFLSTAVYGLFTGVLMMYYSLAIVLPDQCLHENIADTLLNFMSFLDFLKLVSIGTLRFISLRFPLKVIPNKVIYCVWLVELLLAGLLASYGFIVNKSLTNPRSGYLALFASYTTIMLLCMSICLILNYLLWRSLRQITVLKMDKRIYQKHKNGSNRLLVINLIYILSNLPFAVSLVYITAQLNLGCTHPSDNF